MFKPTYEKELKKLDKKYPYKENREYRELKVELDFKYNKIDEYTKFQKLIEIEYEDDEKAKEIKLIALDKQYGKIDELEYEKRMNDIEKNPWAKIRFKYDEKEDPSNLQTEIIYNEYFIKKLISQGYSGNSNDEIVQAWLSQVFAANVDASDLFFDTDKKSGTFIKSKNVEGTKIIG